MSGLPPEPAWAGAQVQDRHGDTWTRGEDGRWHIYEGSPGGPWAAAFVCGPLRLLTRPVKAYHRITLGGFTRAHYVCHVCGAYGAAAIPAELSEKAERHAATHFRRAL